MKPFEHKSFLIDKSHLRAVKVYAFIVLLIDILLSHPVRSLLNIEVVMQSNGFLILVSTLHILLLYFMSRYFSNLGLLRCASYTNIIIATRVLTIVLNLVIPVFYRFDIPYMMNAFEWLNLVLLIGRTVLFILLGLELIRFNEDFIGGLKILGVMAILNAISMGLNILQIIQLNSTYFSFVPNIDPSSIMSILHTAYDIAALLMTISFLLIIEKADKYRKNRTTA